MPREADGAKVGNFSARNFLIPTNFILLTKRMKMNNLQFLATYIMNNPGKTRYSDCIRHLCLWKGYPVHAIMNIGGQYSTYFTRGYLYTHGITGKTYRTGGYKDILWEKIDKNNRNSGFKLTEKGKTYVVTGE